MTLRDNASPVCSLKFVTLLVALSPALLFLGTGVQLQNNGYDGLLIAINPQISEDQNLIPNIKVSGKYEVKAIVPLEQTYSLLEGANNTARFVI